jgi:hypothetical protein
MIYYAFKKFLHSFNVLKFRSRGIVECAVCQVEAIRVHGVEPLRSKQQRMSLRNLARLDAHIVQVALGRRHVFSLFAPLQSKKLAAQCGFHVDCRGVARPRRNRAARVEHLFRVVNRIVHDGHGCLGALVQNGHDGVFCQHGSRAQLRLQRGRRNVAFSHATAQLFGSLLLTECHSGWDAIKSVGHVVVVVVVVVIIGIVFVCLYCIL